MIVSFAEQNKSWKWIIDFAPRLSSVCLLPLWFTNPAANMTPRCVASFESSGFHFLYISLTIIFIINKQVKRTATVQCLSSFFMLVLLCSMLAFLSPCSFRGLFLQACNEYCIISVYVFKINHRSLCENVWIVWAPRTGLWNWIFQPFVSSTESWYHSI